MDLRNEVKNIRPGIGTLLVSLLKFLALSGIVIGYYRYIEEGVSTSMPAIIVCVACLAFACLGSLRTELRYRFLLSRLLKVIDKH